jgi:rhodanese-related sulfurtransferase
MSKSQRDPTPTNVSEISAADLLSECRSGKDVLLLDCREPYEWYQVRIPGSLHIPMHHIPQRLSELPTDGEITVVCAHGIRSYAVAGFLLRSGFRAQSLQGGIEMWQMHGGEVEAF